MTVPITDAARPFGTVGTAMVTPFSADGERLDLDAAQAVAAHLVAHGNDTLVVNGTTGESPTTTDEEKLALVKAVREAVGSDVTLLAGVGSNDTRHSIELARAHGDLDLQGLLVVTPYYSRPSQEGIIAHTEQVADATDLPVLLYDIPSRSGVPLAHETLLRLAQNERILAVKDAKGDLQQAALITAQSDLVYYSGEDALNLAWLALGAAGIVSVVGHVAGDLEAQMAAAVNDGDLPAAQQINRRLAPVVQAIMSRMPGVVAAKTALVLQGVLPHAAVRGPLVPASAPQIAELTEALGGLEGIPPLV
ncbi:4-hydroxy-tetrahydrodipicolinate synthase [Brachybacterium endophyticum]|uniref:4-hydroxy-tetrahydrodipicolinate synthase n=1 Tax=Brachybacterium endophyticum TaxID=2182385 RepID=A0A2U2RLK2_9MICO|nr:4-hydroxy-tetrahydrodipicolinate synthase [Brachybacterium endophyticum]PWH06757.1 4-hydroxy-tetrahydrodipicolinate synthase [Brachybacterium endophyticum]